ncbi:gliding motility lipoprotein GldH [Pedobacter sp. Leaf132]|uniref:gliding motility lipoprotein GldH n=1 Tax=Pedobacter sp. Leaf132 TaxID=2876557 RepID=UPI001E54978B|nr:gliding motility lipoprotein GldH [Pedobacter sp. Leaf132]
MAQITNQLLNRKFPIFFCFLLIVIFFSGCKPAVVDSNNEITDRKWTYRNRIITSFEVKDYTKSYNLYFKLRHTADYKYSNIFILAHFIDGKNIVTKRYQYKLAKNDGEWLGSGSGNIFNYRLPLLTKHRFPKNGKYSIEIEQNMRDNPLLEITDAGILVEEVE